MIAVKQEAAAVVDPACGRFGRKEGNIAQTSPFSNDVRCQHGRETCVQGKWFNLIAMIIQVPMWNCGFVRCVRMITNQIFHKLNNSCFFTRFLYSKNSCIF